MTDKVEYFGQEPPDPPILDMRELLTGDLTRMAHVYRYSSVLVLKKESTAEHTFFTTVYALAVACWVEEVSQEVGGGEGPNLEHVLLRALLHDLEECRTGDINRMFKRSSSELYEAIQEGARYQVRTVLDAVFPNPDSSWIQSLLFGVWNEAKDDTLEGKIVTFADFLSVVAYMLSEMNCSNRTMLRYHEEVLRYANIFNGSDYDFIRPLVTEVHGMIASAFGAIPGP